MAQVVESNIESQPVSKSYFIWRIALLGAGLGVLYWVLTALIMRFIGSISVAGDISTILVATVGIVLMLNLFTARPLLIALAVAVSLWGLAKLTNSFMWYEIIAWNILLYGLSYLLFSWLARLKKITPVLIAAVIIIVIVRIVISL